MGNSGLEKRLAEVCQKHGEQTAINVATVMLESEKFKGESRRPVVNGKIGEATLLMILNNFIEKNKLNWKVYHSLILKDLNSKSKDFLTELDVIVLTPSYILSFESKCYAGANVLKGRGTIQTKISEFDVYAQQKLHMSILMSNVGDFFCGKPSTFPYRMYLFYMGKGHLTDERSLEDKRVMPLTTPYNIHGLLTSLQQVNEENWNFPKLVSAMDLIHSYSPALREKHLTYVQGLNKIRDKKNKARQLKEESDT